MLTAPKFSAILLGSLGRASGRWVEPLRLTLRDEDAAALCNFLFLDRIRALATRSVILTWHTAQLRTGQHAHVVRDWQMKVTTFGKSSCDSVCRSGQDGETVCATYIVLLCRCPLIEKIHRILHMRPG